MWKSFVGMLLQQKTSSKGLQGEELGSFSPSRDERVCEADLKKKTGRRPTDNKVKKEFKIQEE